MLLPALVAAACCGVLALATPRLLAALPEPDAEPDAEPSTSARGIAPAVAKELYVELAAQPWLRPGLVTGSAVVGAAVGASLGWGGALVLWVPLVPLGALLLVVDWRTTLLPTRLLRPAYVVLAGLLLLAALVDRTPDGLVRAAWGWLLLGGWFWVCWWTLGAWGFGDVRLSRLLGPALAYAGWSELAVGFVAMLLLGAFGGVVLTLRDRSLRRRYPYGPFMLVGAALAVVVADDLARALGYPV